MKKNYYEVLGVSREASAAEIKRNYRVLAEKYHPDRTGGDKQAEASFKEIAEAYAVLFDPVKRKKYDSGFNPIESITDLLRLPFGQRLISVMLPTAPSAAQAGVDTMIVIPVAHSIIAQGGRVEVKNPRDGQSLVLNVEPGYQWCAISELGRPGRNGGSPADLYVYLLPNS